MSLPLTVVPNSETAIGDKIPKYAKPDTHSIKSERGDGINNIQDSVFSQEQHAELVKRRYKRLLELDDRLEKNKSYKAATYKTVDTVNKLGSLLLKSVVPNSQAGFMIASDNSRKRSDEFRITSDLVLNFCHSGLLLMFCLLTSIASGVV